MQLLAALTLLLRLGQAAADQIAGFAVAVTGQQRAPGPRRQIKTAGLVGGHCLQHQRAVVPGVVRQHPGDFRLGLVGEATVRLGDQPARQQQARGVVVRVHLQRPAGGFLGLGRRAQLVIEQTQGVPAGEAGLAHQPRLQHPRERGGGDVLVLLTGGFAGDHALGHRVVAALVGQPVQGVAIQPDGQIAEAGHRHHQQGDRQAGDRQGRAGGAAFPAPQ